MFVSWFRLAYPNVLIYHVPSGQLRRLLVAIKLKKMGVVPGIPDLFIPAWKLYIEMKRQKGGSLSDSQKVMIPYLQSCGYDCIIAKGFDDAMSQVLKFRKTFCNESEGESHTLGYGSLGAIR